MGGIQSVNKVELKNKFVRGIFSVFNVKNNNNF